MKELKPVEVRVEDVKLTQFFHPKFVELIESRIPGIRFQHVCFFTLKDDTDKVNERLWIGHDRPKDEIEKITNLSADSSDTLEKLIEITRELLS